MARTAPRLADPITMLHEGARIRIGRFDCDAGHPRWSTDNQVGPWPLLAFPGTPVEIAQAGHREVVATSNHVVLYNPGQVYRRRLVDPRGDHCVFLAVDGGLLAELGEGVDPGLADRGERPFTAAWAPVGSEAVLATSVLVRHLEASAGAERDLVVVEESLLRVLAAVFARGAPPRPRGRPREAERRAEQARALERELAASFREPRSLDELAASVGISPFHATRVFRQHTGLTIHGYRHRLRLQAVLERLGEARVDLTALALETGFCSHSHLTEAFRRAFGAPPSRWRGRIGQGHLRDLTARLGRPGPGQGPGEHRARS
jgi:AraC family transcriptional regulator